MKKTQLFFNKQQETITIKDLKILQIKKLKKVLNFTLENSVFYKKKFSLMNVKIKSLDDFSSKVPFTTKEDLLQNGKYDNLCVPRNKIAEVHFSSGTSNKPVPSFLTKNDIKESNKYLARTWYMQGVNNDSVFAMLASYGLFSAGMINHYAIQNIGAFVIPAGSSSIVKTLNIFKEFGVNSCAAVSSYYLYLINIAESNGINLKDLKLEHVIAGGEPFSEKQRLYIEKKLNANLYDQYGLCEINTGIAGECSEKNGLHILADYVYPEIIDPVTEKLLSDGEEGELVLTTLSREASPLIRYRTGDITSITHKQCSCGRTMPRISRIKRRVKETIFYKGIKIEKSYIATLLEGVDKYLNPYIWQVEVNSVEGKDEFVCRFVLINNNKKDIKYIESYMKKSLGFTVKVIVFSEDDLHQMGIVKLKNFVDNRHI